MHQRQVCRCELAGHRAPLPRERGGWLWAGGSVRKVVSTKSSSAWEDAAEQRVSACGLGWANTSMAQRHILLQTECTQCWVPAGAAWSIYKAGCVLRYREMEL